MDQSGNGNDATTPSFTLNHPKLVTNSIGASSELPVVRFGGNYLNTLNNLPAGNSPYSIFAVIRPSVVGVPSGIIKWGNIGVNDQSNALRLGTTGIVNYWWANDLTVAVSLTPGEPVLITALFDGQTRSIYVNGGLIGSDSPTGKATTATIATIGLTYTQEFFKGDIAELLVFDVGLSSAGVSGRVAVEQYLRAKYDLY